MRWSPDPLEFGSQPSAQPPASSASTELMHDQELLARNHGIIRISILGTVLCVEAADWGKMMARDSFA